MDLKEQMMLVKKVEDLGFASLFVRDSPLFDPKFGDTGVVYDPFMFLTYVTAHTNELALGTASVVTTLRHPLHLAKSAASLDKCLINVSYLALQLVIAQSNFPHLKWSVMIGQNCLESH